MTSAAQASVFSPNCAGHCFDAHRSRPCRARPYAQATALHFADLRARYGDPLIVLNLLKSHERRPRERLLRQELAAAIQLLNSKVQLRGCAPPVSMPVFTLALLLA